MLWRHIMGHVTLDYTDLCSFSFYVFSCICLIHSWQFVLKPISLPTDLLTGKMIDLPRGWYPCRTTDICQVLFQNVRYIFHVAGQCLVTLFQKHGNDRSLTCTFYLSLGHLSCTLFYGYQPLLCNTIKLSESINRCIIVKIFACLNAIQ